MCNFQLSLNTVIEADETLSPIDHACRILRRDMRDHLTGHGPSNMIRVMLQPELGTEKYRAKVDADVLSLTCGDMLGAVYALLSVSERYLDVHPLDWWNGRRPKKTECRMIPEQTWKSPSYAVRYRCWFINDEILLDGWKDTMSDRREVWRRLFETLLRCGGNMVIPGTDRAQDGDELKRLALDMGLWLGQEHTELLGARMFSRVWPELTPSYRLYPEKFEALWREAAEKYGQEKVVFSIGFRGQGDKNFWSQDTNFDTDEKRGALISQIMRRQMEIVRSVQPKAQFMTNLYGEMMALYRKGVLDIPKEVTLLWGDNGFGRMVSRRQGCSNPRADAMPTENSEQAQGIYYHIGFYDLQAANHITMLQVPPQTVVDELKTILKHGANTVWNVNVGSFKPHLFFAALVSCMWREGNCDAEELAREYSRTYYGNEAVAPLFSVYAESAVSYGPHDDDRAGDQFYHFPLRTLANAAIRGEEKAAASLQWISDSLSLRKQAQRLAEIVKSGIESWKSYLRRCEFIADMLDETGRNLLADTLLVQGTIHQTGCETLYCFCQAVIQGQTGNDVQAFLWTHAALRAARKGLLAMREAEHGDFRNFYRNDCFTNVALTVRTLEGMRSFYRLRGDGEMQYDWEKRYLIPVSEKLVVLQTHRWNQLTDEELAEALRGVVPLEEANGK